VLQSTRKKLILYQYKTLTRNAFKCTYVLNSLSHHSWQLPLRKQQPNDPIGFDSEPIRY